MNQLTLAESSQVKNYLDEYYGLVIIASVLLGSLCFLFQFFVISYRYSAFNKNFMLQNFGQIHQDIYNQNISANGYPDMGSGFYSQRLDYNSWIVFNKAQRVHQHFIETITLSILVTLIGGLSFPVTVASISFGECLGRLLTISYVSNLGSSHPFRVFGLLLIYGAIISNSVFSFITAYRLLYSQNIFA